MPHPTATSSRRVGLLDVVALGAMIAASACAKPEIGIDDNSGADYSRVGARKIFPGQRITDNINASVGDNTDWKEIPIREGGTMAVTVAIDNVSGMRGHVALKDTFGLELDRKSISDNNGQYTFDRVPVYPGNYFIQVFAERGKSVYTAGVSFEPTNKPAPRVRVKTVPGAEPSRPYRPYRPRTGTNTTTDDTTDDTTDTTDTTDDTTTDDRTDVTPAQEFTTVSGRITRITPREAGGAFVQIEGVGSANGVAPGMRGSIQGTSASVTITQVRPNSATATTSADAETIKSSSGVTIRIPKK